MSLVAKIVIPVLIIGALVWLYTTKYPSMSQAQQPQQVQQTESEKQAAAANSTTDAQLSADLRSVDTDMQAATDASASADQSFSDTPVTQTE